MGGFTTSGVIDTNSAGKLEDLPCWLDDPHKKAERVKGKEGDGQLEMEM